MELWSLDSRVHFRSYRRCRLRLDGYRRTAECSDRYVKIGRLVNAHFDQWVEPYLSLKGAFKMNVTDLSLTASLYKYQSKATPPCQKPSQNGIEFSKRRIFADY